jgi:hypothetical protein
MGRVLGAEIWCTLLVALETADIALMADDLTNLSAAIRGRARRDGVRGGYGSVARRR